AGERILLRLVDSPLGQKQLREQPLALAQGATLLHRREQTDRVAQELLGLCGIARLPRDEAKLPRRPRDLRDGCHFTVEIECLREPALRRFVLSAHAMQVAFPLCCACARDDAATLLGER